MRMRSSPSRTSRNGRSSSAASSCASRSRPRQRPYDLLAFAAHIDERPAEEIVECRVALIETPPEPAGERLHLLRRDIVEPFPGKRALAHAADGDEAEDAHARSGIGDPIGERVELGLPSD